MNLPIHEAPWMEEVLEKMEASGLKFRA